jgi:hypothetical protein
LGLETGDCGRGDGDMAVTRAVRLGDTSL